MKGRSLDLIHHILRITPLFRRLLLDRIPDYLKSKEYLRLYLILCVSIVEIVLNFGRIFPDSSQYVDFSLFLLGRQGTVSQMYQIVMRPMVPLLTTPLILIFNNVNFSFGLVSGFFWIAGAIVAYKLGKLLLEDDDLATLVALVYVTAPAMLWHGAAVLTDSAAYFFIGLAIYLTFMRERQINVSSKKYFFDAFIVSTGVLFKEVVIFALLFMLYRRFVKRKGFKETLTAIVLIGFCGVLYLSLLGFGPDVFISKYSFASDVQSWGVYPFLVSFVRAYVLSYPERIQEWISVMDLFRVGRLLVFAVATPLGLYFSKRRKDLFMCTLFLFPTAIIWPVMVERFSFCLWPVIVLGMVNGMDFILSKLISTRVFHYNYRIFIYLYVFICAIVNTYYPITVKLEW